LAGAHAVHDRVGALGLTRAVGAAVEAPLDLDAVPDHDRPAVLAPRRHPGDGALEAVERVGGTRSGDLEALVVLVAALLAAGHDALPPRVPRGLLWRPSPREPRAVPTRWIARSHRGRPARGV